MAWELLVFIGAASAITVGCLVPARWLPQLPNDKLLHFAGFALLSALAMRLAANPRQAALWLVSLLIAGWLIECLQTLVPQRAFCWRDLAANAAGIAFSAACAALYLALA